MAQRGLRQGDPLAPFLFLIAAEGLAGLARNATDIGLLRGVKVTNSIQFHMLQFADDTMFTGEGSWENIWTVKAILRSFELVSGLKINFSKSSIVGINLDDDFVEAASTFLSCSIGSIPFKFLGIPVGANPRRGPNKVIKKLTSIQRDFLWGSSQTQKKVVWISWNSVCKTKIAGGLGVKNLDLFNIALLAKWKWRCLCENDAFGIRFLFIATGTQSRTR
ncbi:hypothetical protein QL285_041110 [Trifolium repens]|nr:hypothetical protein QL285_041110 [Trifolium repens]